MQELVLKIAGHVSHPEIVAAVALLVAALLLLYLLRERKPVLAALSAMIILALGAVPFACSSILKSRGVYHIQITVLRPDKSPVELAQVKASTGGELKMDGSGWLLDVPPQSRPADGSITFSASAKDEFLSGKTTLLLGQDYYPVATIQTIAETSAVLRGVVVDEDMQAVAGATVSVDGSPDAAVTDRRGNFVVAAHAGKGQLVEVRATKGSLKGHLSARAGKTVEVIMSRE
jgi:hypothetical protein